MALVSYGMVITNMRGKVGGSVFSANSAGNTVRNKSIPKRRTTDIKSAYNNLWQYLMQSWFALTPAVQTDWDTYAANFTFYNKLGVPVAAKGNVVFACTNLYSYLTGNGFVYNAPVYVPPPIASLSAYFFNITLASAQLIFTPLVADTYFTVYATRPYNFGKRAFMEKRINYIHNTLVLATDDTVEFYTQYVNRYGVPPVGSTILVAWRRISPFSFSWSPLQYIEMTVVA